ncbi:DUF2341 domain-containing protein [bacterium]|nr:DUF2341 domain-containing protein [bacterium]
MTLDNSGGGYWSKYINIPITTTPTEYAQYKVVIDPTNVTVYSADGTQKAQGDVASDFWANVKSDGSDIRVFNQNKEQRYFWIEEWDYANQQATIWVKVEANDTELNIAFGNPSATKSSYEDIGRVGLFGDDNFTTEAISVSKVLIASDGIGQRDHNTVIFRNPVWVHNGIVYGAYLRQTDGNLIVFKYDPSTGNIETFDTGYTTPRYTDSHCGASIAVDSDGYIHVSILSHGWGSPVFIRSTNPEDITNWTTEDYPRSSDNITYHQFFMTPDGTLYAYYRETTDIWKLVKWNNSTQSWETVVDNLVEKGSDPDIYSVYLDIIPDKNGRLHMVFLWRSGDEPITSRNFAYAYSDDSGATWKHINGSPYTLPITEDQITQDDCVDPSSHNTMVPIMNQMKFDVDLNGNPIIAYVKQDGAHLNYFVSHYDGSSWNVQQLTYYTFTPDGIYTMCQWNFSRPTVIVKEDGRAFIFTRHYENSQFVLYYADPPYTDWDYLILGGDRVGRSEYGLDFHHFKNSGEVIWLWSPTLGTDPAPIYLYIFNPSSISLTTVDEINTMKWADYSETGTTISVSNGILTIDNGADNIDGKLTVVEKTFSENIVIVSKARLATYYIDNTNWMGWMALGDTADAWVVNTGSGYNALVKANGNGQMLKDGSTIVGDTALGVDTSQWHKYAFVVSDSGVKLLVDDIEKLTYSESISRTGYVGLRTYGVNAEFDYIFVAKLADPADFGTPTILTFDETGVYVTNEDSYHGTYSCKFIVDAKSDEGEKYVGIKQSQDLTGFSKVKFALKIIELAGHCAFEVWLDDYKLVEYTNTTSDWKEKEVDVSSISGTHEIKFIARAKNYTEDRKIVAYLDKVVKSQ